MKGVYRFSIQRACELALSELMRSANKTSLQYIVFACFDSKVEKALQNILSQYESNK